MSDGFAGLPYNQQATVTGAPVPVVPEGARYESLPPPRPHATYEAAVVPPGVVHPYSRLRDVQRVLRGFAKSARAAAHDLTLDQPASLQAAALRGKARGYDEAADLIESTLRGGRVRRKWRVRRG